MDVYIHPTYIEITDYHDELKRSLYPLRLWDENIHSYVFEGYEYNKKEHKLLLPTGFGADYVLQVLTRRGTSFNVYDFRRNETLVNTGKKPRIKLNVQPRDNLQVKAINFLKFNPMEQSFGQKMLSLDTGQGKTYCAINAVIFNQRVPLIMVKTNALGEQWKKRYLEYTDLEEDQVRVISGKDDLIKLYNSPKKDLDRVMAVISFYRTIDGLLLNENDEYNFTLNQFLDKLGISLKIFDEAHLDYRAILRIDLHTKLPSFYLTATPKRSDINEDKVYQKIFSMPKFKSSDIMNPDRYRIYIFKHIKSNPKFDERAYIQKKSTRGFNFNAYTDYLMNNEKSYKIYADAIFSIYWKSIKQGSDIKKTAIFFKNIAMVDKMYEDFSQRLSDLDIDEDKITLSRFHGKVKAKEKKTALDSDLIFTTTSSLGTGQDIKGLQVIISTINTSSEVTLKQLSGRLRPLPDKDVFFIDIIDDSFKDIQRQYRQKKRIYQKNAKKIYNVKLS